MEDGERASKRPRAVSPGPLEAMAQAARSARFFRRVSAASAAPALSDELAVGTQARFEAEAAVLLWAEVRVAYPALEGVSDEELAEAYQTLTADDLVTDEYGRLAKDPTTSGMDGVSGRIGALQGEVRASLLRDGELRVQQGLARWHLGGSYPHGATSPRCNQRRRERAQGHG